MQCSTIMANCAPAVYIHSQMVGQIAKTLGEDLIDREPSRFIGICGCTSASQVKLRRGRIAHMLYECGLYHDLGKIAYLDIFNVISRNLFPEEFEFIRLHARAGYEMLSRHDSTRPYAQVALASPPYLPAPGPISMMISAAAITSMSCSITSTVFPKSRSFFSILISPSVSFGCSPAVGSSRI